MNTKWAAGLVAPASFALLLGSAGPAGAADLKEAHEFTFTTRSTFQEVTCDVEVTSRFPLPDAPSEAAARTIVTSDERFGCTLARVAIDATYLNSSGDQVRVSASGDRDVQTHYWDVASDLRTTHVVWFSDCDANCSTWYTLHQK